MLVGKMSDGRFIIGLDAVIVVELSKLGEKDSFAIMFGPTLDHIKEILEDATGQELPEATEAEFDE